MNEKQRRPFANTFRVTRVENKDGTDITGFASEGERITLYYSVKTRDFRCLVSKEFSRSGLNWERIRFQPCDGEKSLEGRLAGHDVAFTIDDSGCLCGTITGNPVGTIMAEVD